MSARDDTEIAEVNSLSEGWEWATLGDISEKPQYGWTTKANRETGELKLLRTTDITSGAITWSSVPFCTEVPEDVEKYLVESGDILISRAGSVGVSFLINKPERAVFASYLIRFRPKSSIDTKYFYYYLKSPAYWTAIGASKSGIAVPNVNASKLAKVPIPIAPQSQQKIIVAEIEKQFSRLDEAVANLKRVKANLKRYKAAVLKAAVEGKLTEEWRKQNPDVEPADKLLDRILTERRRKWEEAELAKMKAKGKTPKGDKWKQKYKEPKAPDTTGLPEFPEGWVSASIGQVTIFSFYGPRFSSENYSETGPYVLRTTDIDESGRVDTATAPRISLSTEDLEKYRVARGDLLVTRTGSLGTLALFNDDVDAIPGAYLIQFRLNLESVTRRYLFLCLKSSRGQAYLTGGGAGVGRPNINAPKLEAFTFPLPPLHEQARIVAEVDRRFSLIRDTEMQLGADLRRASRLQHSILSKAFTVGLSQNSKICEGS